MWFKCQDGHLLNLDNVFDIRVVEGYYNEKYSYVVASNASVSDEQVLYVSPDYEEAEDFLKLIYYEIKQNGE